MKKVIYLWSLVAVTVAFASCNSNDSQNLDSATQNLELRAASLGFSNVDAYQAFVANQCAAGNHENCCPLKDGTCQACPYPDHLGMKCDGSHRHGAAHGMQNGKGNGSSDCCKNFVDADGDGICDNCINPVCKVFVDANGDGICDNCKNPDCKNFKDADGDGKCDNCTNPNCTGFVDADGDGKCDNCTNTGTGTRPQDGTGEQHGKGKK